MIRSHSIIGVVLLCLFVSSRAFVIQKLTNHVPTHCPRRDICLLVEKSRNLQRWPTITTLPSTKRQNEESSFDTSNAISPSFRRRWRKRVSKFSKTLLLASAFLSVAMGPKAAHAKFAHELQDERTMSLRPGVTQDQAIALNEGEVPDDLPEPSSSSTLQNLQQQRQQEQQQSETKKSSKRSFDYGDDDDDDGDDFDDFLDDDDKSRKSSLNTRTSISKSELSKASDFQSSTKSQFSGMGPKSTAQSRMLTLKVSIGLFIPTWGAMGVREFVRRRKEEKYVKKGLEILEAQKAEYFNITETTPDSDIEDELKDLKDEDEDEEDESDDDEEEEDEEDEEDLDESPPRRTPKRPSGGPRDDSGGSSGGGDGDGRPSEDDLKRLGDIFNKS